jgi:hypothetical protein
MSLVFSLLAALLAILVQQWVRDYMHVFQRYRNPLKSSRLRQYLYEGCEGWYMPMVAEAVPGFLHISLFLFFAGLGDSLLNINTKVAISAIALPKFVFRHILVFVPEVAWPEIQGSRIRWRNETCRHEHGTRIDAAYDGRDGGTRWRRCSGDSMVDA